MDTKKLKALLEEARKELAVVADTEFKARRMGGLRALGAADQKLEGALKKLETAESRSAGKTSKKKAAAADTTTGGKKK